MSRAMLGEVKAALAQSSNTDDLRRMLGHMDLTQADASEQMVLHEAARAGEVEVARALVEQLGVNVNQTAIMNDGIGACSEYGVPLSAVSVAIESRQEEVVQTLVDLGAALNYKDLMLAATHGASARVIRLLGQEDCIDVRFAVQGVTVLHLASAFGHAHTVRALVEMRADVDAVESEGITGLWVAAQNGHAETVAVLADLGADVNHLARDHKTSPAFEAADRGHEQVLRVLADHNADLDKGDINGGSPVYIASYRGHASTVRMLCEEFGVDIDHPTKYGISPLCAAARQGHTHVIDVLAELGADINQPTAPQAVMVAEAEGPVVVAMAYLQAGTICASRMFNTDATPLNFACYDGNVDVVRTLIKLGADLNRPNEMGHSPVYYAIRMNHKQIVFALVEAGCRGEVPDDHESVRGLIPTIELGLLRRHHAPLRSAVQAIGLRGRLGGPHLSCLVASYALPTFEDWAHGDIASIPAQFAASK